MTLGPDLASFLEANALDTPEQLSNESLLGILQKRLEAEPRPTYKPVLWQMFARALATSGATQSALLTADWEPDYWAILAGNTVSTTVSVDVFLGRGDTGIPVRVPKGKWVELPGRDYNLFVVNNGGAAGDVLAIAIARLHFRAEW